MDTRTLMKVMMERQGEQRPPATASVERSSKQYVQTSSILRG